MVDMNPNNVYVTRAEMEQFVIKFLETHLSKAVEDYIEKNFLRVKELELIERVVKLEIERKKEKSLNKS